MIHQNVPLDDCTWMLMIVSYTMSDSCTISDVYENCEKNLSTLFAISFSRLRIFFAMLGLFQ